MVGVTNPLKSWIIEKTTDLKKHTYHFIIWQKENMNEPELTELKDLEYY